MRKTGALLAVEIRTAVHRCSGCNRRHRKRRRGVITAADFRRGQGGDGACGAGGYLIAHDQRLRVVSGAASIPRATDFDEHVRGWGS